MVASGQGVSSSPVSTSDRPTTLCRKKGRETRASIWAQNEQTDVQMESEKRGIRSRSTGSKGAGRVSWRRTKKKPIASRAMSSAPVSISDCPCAKPLSAVISRPKVRAFITALATSKRGMLLLGPLAGRKRRAKKIATIPSGTLMANSHCHDATERIAAAMVGPAAEETATINEFIPIPRPRWRWG